MPTCLRSLFLFHFISTSVWAFTFCAPDILSMYPDAHPLPLREGEVTSFERSRYFSSFHGWREVWIEPQDEEIPKMSELLAEGMTSLSAQEIEERLRASPRIALSDLLPPVTRDSAAYAACSNANCWNATLNWDFPETGVRFTTPEEIEKALRTRYRVLGPGTAIRFGDVLVIRRRRTAKILHTARYLTRGFVWHKPSSHPDDPPTFQTLESTLAAWSNLHAGEIWLEFYRLKR